tara:strand:- start:248 stop:559 length:312 start_codon:yes stop_codon:yes gene_type:complete
MKTPDPLGPLLSRWQPDVAPADPSFAAEVWRRIDQPVHVRPSPLARLIRFPAALPLAAGLAIMCGVVTAVSVNRAEHRATLAAAYARSIDPLQLVGAMHHPQP